MNALYLIDMENAAAITTDVADHGLDAAAPVHVITQVLDGQEPSSGSKGFTARPSAVQYRGHAVPSWSHDSQTGVVTLTETGTTQWGHWVVIPRRVRAAGQAVRAGGPGGLLGSGVESPPDPPTADGPGRRWGVGPRAGRAAAGAPPRSGASDAALRMTSGRGATDANDVPGHSRPSGVVTRGAVFEGLLGRTPSRAETHVMAGRGQRGPGGNGKRPPAACASDDLHFQFPARGLSQPPARERLGPSEGANHDPLAGYTRTADLRGARRFVWLCPSGGTG